MVEIFSSDDFKTLFICGIGKELSSFGSNNYRGAFDKVKYDVV
jgi:hypothetical protein